MVHYDCFPLQLLGVPGVKSYFFVLFYLVFCVLMTMTSSVSLLLCKFSFFSINQKTLSILLISSHQTHLFQNFLNCSNIDWLLFLSFVSKSPFIFILRSPSLVLYSLCLYPKSLFFLLYICILLKYIL